MAIAGRLCNNVLRGFASKTALLSAPVQTQRAKRVRVCCDPWFFQDRPRFSTMPDVVRYQLGEEAQLVIQQGDITQWNGDAIVNAANEVMLGGGGVDGAIHRAAGPSLVQACKLYPPQGGRCPTGDARVTLAYDLPCKWVIHTVGPVYERRNANACAQMLSKAYRSSLAVANGIGAKSVAFPAISCGVYGYPLDAACYAAIRTCFDYCQDVKEVHFVLFGSDTYNVWISQANKYFKPADSQQDDEGQQSEETMQSSEGAAVQDQQVVDTLTGAKKGADSQAAQAAMEEQPVLEDSKPVAAPEMAEQSSTAIEHESAVQSNKITDKDTAADDADKRNNAPASHSTHQDM